MASGPIVGIRQATIANGASLSNGVLLASGVLVAIQMPAAWTAAVLTFQGSVDGTNWCDLYDDGGNEYSATVAASHHVNLDASIFMSAPYVKVRSGTGGAAVNQGADRLLTLIARKDLPQW